MTNPKIQLDRSPFERKRNMTAPRGSPNMQTQVSHDVEIELMQVIRNYNREHHIEKKKGKEQNAPALKHILIDFLNTHCIEQCSFKNLNALVIVSKENTCELIGFVEGDVELDRQDPFEFKPLLENRFKFIYSLASFNKENYELLNLSEVKGAEVFNISREKRGDFDSVREHLRPDQDRNIDDSYFALFSLNNYLDVLKDGVYVSRTSTYSHEGIVVLIDPEDHDRRVYLRFIWSYSRGELDLQLHVESKKDFNNKVLVSIKDYEVIEEYLQIDKEPSRKELKERRESLVSIKESVDGAIEDIDRQLSQMK